MWTSVLEGKNPFQQVKPLLRGLHAVQ